MGDLFYNVFIKPFVEMAELPDLFVQVLWEGFVSGTLYSLIALGFVLIFKASGVFNFAQGIMVVFGALSLVGLYAQSTVSPSGRSFSHGLSGGRELLGMNYNLLDRGPHHHVDVACLIFERHTHPAGR